MCSGEQELTSLVINDLYYHVHGELEGRQITSGPFQELLCFLLEWLCGVLGVDGWSTRGVD